MISVEVLAALLLAIGVLFLLTVIAGLLAVLGIGVQWAFRTWTRDIGRLWP